MRWTKNKKPTHVSSPCLGDERVIEIFLWLPLCIKDETRWLEFCIIRQRYTLVPGSSLEFGYKAKWTDIEWIEVR